MSELSAEFSEKWFGELVVANVSLMSECQKLLAAGGNINHLPLTEVIKLAIMNVRAIQHHNPSTRLKRIESE